MSTTALVTAFSGRCIPTSEAVVGIIRAIVLHTVDLCIQPPGTLLNVYIVYPGPEFPLASTPLSHDTSSEFINLRMLATNDNRSAFNVVLPTVSKPCRLYPIDATTKGNIMYASALSPQTPLYRPARGTQGHKHPPLQLIEVSASDVRKK